MCSKAGSVLFKCWQSTDLSEGVYSASIETNPWHSLSAAAIRALVDCIRACAEEDCDEERQTCILIHQ